MQFQNPITAVIIVVTVVISIVAFNNRGFFEKWKFNSYEVYYRKKFLRLISYGFIHASYIHLAINMFVLWSFGEVVEKVFAQLFPVFGGLLFAVMYLSAIVVSTLYSTFKHRNNTAYSAVGASGAVSAVVFGSILFDPTAGIYFFFIPIPIPAFIFGLLYLVYSWVMGRRGKDNIGHDAHFWGALYGLVFIIACEPRVVIYFIDRILNYF
jgi:membrane associated rhomboid family serine protease